MPSSWLSLHGLSALLPAIFNLNGGGMFGTIFLAPHSALESMRMIDSSFSVLESRRLKVSDFLLFIFFIERYDTKQIQNAFPNDSHQTLATVPLVVFLNAPFRYIFFIFLVISKKHHHHHHPQQQQKQQQQQ